jgi:hypothetical protein
MNFEPITRWVLRCTGSTTAGRCTALFEFHPDGDDENGLELALWKEPELAEHELMWLRRGDTGWLLLPGERVVCPQHVEAAEQMVRAVLDGLPFDEAVER